MKHYFLAVILFSSLHTYCQQNGKEFLKYYMVSKETKFKDTVDYCKVAIGSKGYTFHFPETTSLMFSVKDSSNFLLDTIKTVYKDEYGPYQFWVKGARLMFRNLSEHSKKWPLYELRGKLFLAPELFSSGDPSYGIETVLANPNASLVMSSGKTITCYKFIQNMEYKGHKKNDYRVLYIDHKTLLPYKWQYYADKNLAHLTKEIYAVESN